MQQEKELVKQKAKDLLLKLLSIYTPSKNERNAENFFEEVSNDLNLRLEILPQSNSFILGEGDILLASHVDTIPGYIEPKAENDTIYGRGAVDAKGPLIAMILTAWLLNEKGIKVRVAALADEESTSIGAKELLMKNYNVKHIIVGEPSNNTDIVIEYRGSIQLDIICKGTPEHSSSAKDNIIVNIAKKLLEVYKLPEGYDKPSIVPTIINAGEVYNVTPARLYLHFDIRYAINNDREELISRIREEFSECRVEIVDETPPVKVSANNPVVRSLTRALLKQGMKPRLVRKAGTSDMNILQKLTQNIATYGPGNSTLEHTNQEKISLDEIYIGVKTYMLAIEELWQRT
ncbi:N-acetyl-lysine deacetylase [Sulfolobus tengchongensis]|uniref:[LysW]-lysine/[LysW]-ornithine hydrolase n=1 Tax=Sulfolobus tengchongensis TaxID=207809 RepID=A0AAX4KYX1_9CREN